MNAEVVPRFHELLETAAPHAVKVLAGRQRRVAVSGVIMEKLKRGSEDGDREM